MLEYILSGNLTHTATADKGVGSNVHYPGALF